MRQRTQDLPLRYRWSGRTELLTTLAQLVAVFGLMGLFAAVVMWFG
ncbi:MAG TPA: hypothetical protein VJS89_03625 [Gammaproteobacteria bacterium]|nr:hypothetical protein [Gammaproteobacteria bacterium]